MMAVLAARANMNKIARIVLTLPTLYVIINPSNEAAFITALLMLPLHYLHVTRYGENL